MGSFVHYPSANLEDSCFFNTTRGAMCNLLGGLKACHQHKELERLHFQISSPLYRHKDQILLNPNCVMNELKQRFPIEST